MGIRAMHCDVNFGMHIPQHVIASERLFTLSHMHIGSLEWEDSCSGDLLIWQITLRGDFPEIFV